MTTTCPSRWRGASFAYDCDQPAGHTGPHQTHRDGEFIAGWTDEAAEPRESAPSAGTDPQTDRQVHRDTLRYILDRIDRGKTLTAAERHALRTTTTAEQDDADQARAEHEKRRTALIAAIELPDTAGWPRITQAAADLRRAATEATDRADVAAARQAEQQAGETLTTRHRQLCDALGVGPYSTTSWPDLIDRAATVKAAAYERADLLEDARDALSTAGQNGPHGDDWPAIAPAIRSLAADLDLRRRNDEVNRREASIRRVALATALGLDTGADWDAITARATAAEATLARVRTAIQPLGPLSRQHIEKALAQPPAGPCDCGQTDCTWCVPVHRATHVDSHHCTDDTTRPYCRESCTACAGTNAVPCPHNDARERNNQ